ncbi:MAG: hypothetical protein FJ379_07115 [Verrucomicrobia bacterium]|nr:hypothetical protein [Verrucomicrobiota bacterium]
MKRPGTTFWLVIAAAAAGGVLLWDRGGSGSHTPVRSVGGSRTSASGSGAATNAPSATAATNEIRSLATWVAERNIFDPSRQPRIPGAPPRPVSRPRSTEAPTFTLVGVLKAQKGPMAFFDSGTSEYRKAIPLNGSIAGYTVIDITPARVRLSISNQPPLDLRVGARMRQDGETGWQLADAGGMATSPTSGGTSAPGSGAASSGSGGNGAEDEILKRLMKKREQESQ